VGGLLLPRDEVALSFARLGALLLPRHAVPCALHALLRCCVSIEALPAVLPQVLPSQLLCLLLV